MDVLGGSEAEEAEAPEQVVDAVVGVLEVAPEQVVDAVVGVLEVAPRADPIVPRYILRAGVSDTPFMA